MTYVPHLPCTISLGEPHTVFAQSAADNLVNTTFDFCGVPVVVTKAWIEDGEMMLVINRPDKLFEKLSDLKEVEHGLGEN